MCELAFRADMTPDPLPHRLLEEHAGDIFKLVYGDGRTEQWAAWLRVPLERAASTGNAELFNALLEAGADASEGRWGCRPALLAEAASGGNLEVVTSMLERGAVSELETDSFGGGTPLLTATEKGHEAVARYLIRAGADVSYVSFFGISVLYEACSGGHEQIVEDLLAAGADPNDLSGCDHFEWRSPLHVAAEKGRLSIVSRLLRGGADADMFDGCDITPLILATQQRHLPIVETLLAAGADANAVGWVDDEYHLSALGMAAQQGYRDIVEAILAAGADVNTLLGDGSFSTALQHAASKDHVGIIDALVEAGANLEIMDDYGMTPLMHAASYGAFKAMGALLRYGAAVNGKESEEGHTALHLVCGAPEKSGFEAAVDMLLIEGADETALDNDGKTPTALLGSLQSEEARRGRVLLARAPADRAWRRRGWLVVLRSRAESSMRETPSTKSRDGGNARSTPRHAPGELFGGESREAGGGDESERILSVAVETLVQFFPEGVFCAVVRFL